LYRVLRDPVRFEQFQAKVEMTLFGKVSQNEAIVVVEQARQGQPVDEIELAWALYVQQNQSVVASTRRTQGQWSRSMVESGGMASVVSAWRSLKGSLPDIHARLARVQVDQRPALEVVRSWDSPATVFYLDPPYVLDTRVERSMYAVEMADAHHLELVEALPSVRGMVTLSGYDHPIYEPLVEAGWARYDYTRLTSMTASQRGSDGEWDREIRPRGTRTEVVWLNPAADRATGYAKGRLF
jgi:DNA adenine methylase